MKWQEISSVPRDGRKVWISLWTRGKAPEPYLVYAVVAEWGHTEVEGQTLDGWFPLIHPYFDPTGEGLVHWTHTPSMIPNKFLPTHWADFPEELPGEQYVALEPKVGHYSVSPRDTAVDLKDES